MELVSNNNNYDNFINRLEEYASKPDNTVFADCDIKGMSNFYKDDKASKVWWVARLDSVGEFLFSFDSVNVNIKMYKKWKIKMYNLGSTIHQLSYHQ